MHPHYKLARANAKRKYEAGSEVTAQEKFEATIGRNWRGHAIAAGVGRAALYLLLRALDVRGARVLLPEFICAQVIEAVRRAGAEPAFYGVTETLQVRAEEVERQLGDGARAVVVAHYFGRTQRESARIADVCKAQGVACIEDCSLVFGAAHGTLPVAAELAFTSLTKSEWCYGGGVAIARDAKLTEKMRLIRDAEFSNDDEFCERYGQLSRCDFEANHPRRSEEAARRGRELQEQFAKSDARWANANFFDAARSDARMSEHCAVRARQILEHQRELRTRRGTILREILRRASCDEAEDGSQRTSAGTRVLPGKGNCAFITLVKNKMGAGEMAEMAAQQGVTLRAAWCDYQSGVPQSHLRDRIAILEIHPELGEAEIETVAKIVREV